MQISLVWIFSLNEMLVKFKMLGSIVVHGSMGYANDNFVVTIHFHGKFYFNFDLLLHPLEPNLHCYKQILSIFYFSTLLDYPEL